MNKPFVENAGARRPKRRQKGAGDSEDKYHAGSSSFQDEPFTNQDCDEIIMFSTDFKIEYNHFDAQDTKNEHQIKMHASCKDMGVQVIQRFMQPGASQVSESFISNIQKYHLSMIPKYSNTNFNKVSLHK
jgi:hypothetical protein